MTLLSAVLLAALQGLTEFLPVSSSGHLVLAGMLLEVPEGGVAFEVLVHLGTLLAVLAVYGRDLAALVAGCFRGDRTSLRTAGLLALASVPAGAVGVFLGGAVESAFGNPVLVCVMLLVTGTVLYLTRFAPAPSREGPSPAGSLLIGIAQACAVLPGISRSGVTISTGLFRGLEQSKAARFSFLLSVPAIAGAGLVKLRDMGSTLDAGVAAVALVVSAVVGYLALRILLRFLGSGRFGMFSWYCWLLGASGLAYILLKG
jgi:undecaprenyl-diphosphatase